MEQFEPRKDPIVEEVRKAREAHAEKFNHDLDAIIRDLKRHELDEGREVVSLSPRILDQKQGAA